jgi:Ca-activated chloride channel family protein
MNFANPTALLLLLLVPAAVGGALWVWRVWERSTAAWVGRGLWPRLVTGLDRRRRAVSITLLGVAIGATAVALAEPRWGLVLQEVAPRGADVVFVVDSSRSMAAEDVRPSRLAVARGLVRQMLDALPGVPVGLVQAEGDGVSLAPLSLDTALVGMLTASLESGTLPQPGTALAPALTRAYQLFRAGEGERVVVLLSDGEDHRGGVREVAERLAQTGVVVHTLGIGTAAGSRIALERADGETDWIRDRDGQPVLSRLQEIPLRELAEITGGRYHAVARADFDPAPLVREILAAEGGRRTVATIERQRPRFQWALVVAAAALAGLLFWGPGRGA